LGPAAKREVMMEDQDIQGEAPPDPLADQIAQSVRGVVELRQEQARLKARAQELERENALFESENAAYRAQLETEKVGRAYYQRFAVVVATSLNLVAQVCSDVMAKMQTAVQTNNSMRRALEDRESQDTTAPNVVNPQEAIRANVPKPQEAIRPSVAKPQGTIRTSGPVGSDEIPSFLRNGPNGVHGKIR
jgi:hypothetical protein